MNGEQAEQLLAVTQIELARRLTVTSRTIRNWERRGMIQGVRRGGVKLYPFNDAKRLAGVK